MPPTRIIARLDIKGENVIKGVNLEGLRVVGKPSEMAHKYYNQGADELLYMDAVASLYGRNSILHIVEDAARDIFVPMTVGGGLRTLDDIKTVLRSGADKVAINTAAVNRPVFLGEAARAFGSQCIVLSVEAIRREPGSWEAMTDNGRERTGRNVLDWIQEAERFGVGEVLLTSIDKEGTQSGFDLPLIEAVSKVVKVPVIASGGAGSADHVAAMIKDSRTEAVACASVFHYDTCSVGDVKTAVIAAGGEVRP